MGTRKVSGIIIMVAALIWTFQFGWLYYEYLFTDILYYYMFPTWVLIVNIVAGMGVVWMGYRLTFGRTDLKRALMITLALMALSLSITYIVPLYW